MVLGTEYDIYLNIKILRTLICMLLMMTIFL